MTTLGAALDSSAQQVRVDAAVADPADYYKIDSEVVQLLSHRQASAAYLAGDPTLWRVVRGVAGTTAASHLNGATLTALYPQIALSPVESAGGGGVSVTDGLTTVAATTIQQAAGTVVDQGAGVATVLPVIFSSDDPGAVGAGTLWVQDHEDGNVSMWVRKADDSGWLAPSTTGLLFYALANPNPLTAQVIAQANTASLLGKSDDAQTQAGVNADAANGVQLTMIESGGGYFQVVIPPLGTELQLWDAGHGTAYPGMSIKMGTADPSAGGGVVAGAGSLYSRQNGTAGELWIKSGVADTAWQKATLT